MKDLELKAFLVTEIRKKYTQALKKFNNALKFCLGSPAFTGNERFKNRLEKVWDLVLKDYDRAQLHSSEQDATTSNELHIEETPNE